MPLLRLRKECLKNLKNNSSKLIKQCFFVFFVFLTITSCDWLKDPDEGIVVARVGESKLYKSDVNTFFKDISERKDSLLKVSSFINNWATKQLLLDGAKRNLSKAEQENFNKLAEEYRLGLYMSTYKDALVNKQLDTIVSDAEAQAFYEKNKQNFNLNEDLLKLKYIQIGEDYNHKKQLKEYFTRFNEKDKYALDSLKLQFKKYFLNDSIWVKKSVVTQSISPVSVANADKLLKKTNFVQLQDSLGLYLISVRETLSRKQIAPLEYVRPTINQIIKNKRKLALVKQLEKEIKDDAIKNNKFEIYR